MEAARNNNKNIQTYTRGTDTIDNQNYCWDAYSLGPQAQEALKPKRCGIMSLDPNACGCNHLTPPAAFDGVNILDLTMKNKTKKENDKLLGDFLNQNDTCVQQSKILSYIKNKFCDICSKEDDSYIEQATSTQGLIPSKDEALLTKLETKEERGGDSNDVRNEHDSGFYSKDGVYNKLDKDQLKYKYEVVSRERRCVKCLKKLPDKRHGLKKYLKLSETEEVNSRKKRKNLDEKGKVFDNEHEEPENSKTNKSDNFCNMGVIPVHSFINMNRFKNVNTNRGTWCENPNCQSDKSTEVLQSSYDMYVDASVSPCEIPHRSQITQTQDSDEEMANFESDIKYTSTPKKSRNVVNEEKEVNRNLNHPLTAQRRISFDCGNNNGIVHGSPYTGNPGRETCTLQEKPINEPYHQNISGYIPENIIPYDRPSNEPGNANIPNTENSFNNQNIPIYQRNQDRPYYPHTQYTQNAQPISPHAKNKELDHAYSQNTAGNQGYPNRIEPNTSNVPPRHFPYDLRDVNQSPCRHEYTQSQRDPRERESQSNQTEHINKYKCPNASIEAGNTHHLNTNRGQNAGMEAEGTHFTSLYSEDPNNVSEWPSFRVPESSGPNVSRIPVRTRSPEKQKDDRNHSVNRRSCNLPAEHCRQYNCCKKCGKTKNENYSLAPTQRPNSNVNSHFIHYGSTRQDFNGPNLNTITDTLCPNSRRITKRSAPSVSPRPMCPSLGHNSGYNSPKVSSPERRLKNEIFSRAQNKNLAGDAGYPNRPASEKKHETDSHSKNTPNKLHLHGGQKCTKKETFQNRGEYHYICQDFKSYDGKFSSDTKSFTITNHEFDTNGITRYTANEIGDLNERDNNKMKRKKITKLRIESKTQEDPNENTRGHDNFIWNVNKNATSTDIDVVTKNTVVSKKKRAIETYPKDLNATKKIFCVTGLTNKYLNTPEVRYKNLMNTKQNDCMEEDINYKQ